MFAAALGAVLAAAEVGAVLPRALVGPAASFWAKASDYSPKEAAGKTAVTSPMSRASLAAILSPVIA